MSYGKGNRGFDKALEKGTSQLLLDADWDAIIALCDYVRSGEVKPKYAVDSVMKKISQDNQTVAKFALQILESMVKNCGPKMHNEVATSAFMDFMKEQAKVKTDSVKAKLLELIQCWSYAFRDNSDFSAVTRVFEEMKKEGFSFPTLREADAMFAAEVPPEWKEGSSCFGCRTEFGLITRKHHCRACGQIFCSKCSGKSSMIPKYGIETEVRVCDPCYRKLNPAEAPSSQPSGAESDLPPEYLNSALYKQAQTPPKSTKSEQEIAEEEELQLALAISQSEAESKEQERKKRQNFMSLDANPPVTTSSSGPVQNIPAPVMELEDDSAMSPELMKYLNRNYWEQKQASQSAAPVHSQPIVKVDERYPSTTQPSAPSISSVSSESYQNGDAGPPSITPEETDEEREQFIAAMSGSIDVFVNRMNSNSMRGRSIVNDSAVQTLFATLQNMHPHLLQHIQAQEENRSQSEGLQDKLAQLRDAREALVALRQEHAEKRRLEAEERERKKQIQMAQKLEILRKKKQESLDIQRQIALQKLQQQEAEMAMRFEQQKQLAQMRQMQLHGFPQELQPGYAQYGQPTGDYQMQYNVPGAPQQQQLPGVPQGYTLPGYEQQPMNDPNQMAYNGNYQQQPPTGYGMPPQASHQQNMYQQPYNMQGMSEALPQYGGQLPPNQGAMQVLTSAMPPGQPANVPLGNQHYPGQPMVNPQAGYGEHQSGQYAPPPQQPPQQNVDQLISFD